jgi:large subunit ribosomal protein L18
MDRNKKKRKDLKRRHLRLRKKISGTASCPRLSVYRSLKHIYAQLIDDEKGMTLAAASSQSPELKSAGGNVSAATEVGKLLAKKASEKNINKVIFDRGGRRYHGRVKALADGARESGLQF